MGLAALVSACGDGASKGPPSADELIRSSLPLLQLEALCPVRAMGDAPSFAVFDRNVAELGLTRDSGQPTTDPRYDEAGEGRWVVNDRVETADGAAPQGRTTIWIGELQPGRHDFRYFDMKDRNGRSVGKAGHDGERRFASAMSCVLHIDGMTREGAASIRNVYRESFYEGLATGAWPATPDHPAPEAEHRWINGNTNTVYVETDLLSPKPGETGVTMIRRYFFW